jgi:hypothetical protein
MTFEDDRREKFRKDLIKALPIDVEEDSEDERWGFTSNHGVRGRHIPQNHGIMGPPQNPAFAHFNR